MSLIRRLILCATLLTIVGCGAAIDEEQLDAILALEGDATAGESFYDSNCARCHGPNGNGDGRGPELAGASYSREEIVEATLRGPLSMPSFNDESDQDLANVAAYVESL